MTETIPKREEYRETFKITFDEVDENEKFVHEHEYVLRFPALPIEEFFLTSGYLVLATGRIRNYKAIRSNRPSEAKGIQRLYLEARAERKRKLEAERRGTQ